MTVRRWLFYLVVCVLLLGYVYVAVTVLPQWIVSLTAGKADANTQLNAVTGTRAALLGMLTPLVILIGGIVGLRTFREIRVQNALTNDRARAERDETRRLRRAEVYADMISTCSASWSAAHDMYYGDQADPTTQLGYLRETKGVMDLAYDRVFLLGSDTVQASARALNLHLGGEIIAKANVRPKVPEADWKRITVTEYDPLYRAFTVAARADLAPIG